MLSIHNSMTGRKETFTPMEPGKVRMYVCGLTVYDNAHLGHARMLIVFDVVVRYLRHVGYDVTFVRNITDIDDNILNRAAENGEDYRELTSRFIKANDEDFQALGLLRPDHEPRATECIDSILRMIADLIERGYAYAADNGDVYYAVRKFSDYGRLSGKRLDDLRAGARIEVDEAKNDPLDFVLWKAAKPDEPQWESPWGPGRPGWHIECSAMSTSLLGNHFDIHGGGMDLKFPHHENEIAQSCAATGEAFVNLWMHNGFVRVDDEKMSKSLGNFFTVNDVTAVYQGEVIRYMMLGSHYRSPLNYSEGTLDQSQAALDRLYLAVRGLDDAEPVDLETAENDLRAVMDDDFNTSGALAVLQGLAGRINTARDGGDMELARGLAATLRRLGGILGILGQDPEQYLKRTGTSQTGESDIDAAWVEERIAARNAARAAKDWAAADAIRDELTDAGIILEDGSAGTTWRRS